MHGRLLLFYLLGQGSESRFVVLRAVKVLCGKALALLVRVVCGCNLMLVTRWIRLSRLWVLLAGRLCLTPMESLAWAGLGVMPS